MVLAFHKEKLLATDSMEIFEYERVTLVDHLKSSHQVIMPCDSHNWTQQMDGTISNLIAMEEEGGGLDLTQVEIFISPAIEPEARQFISQMQI